MTPLATGSYPVVDFSLDSGEATQASTWLVKAGNERGVPEEPLSRLDLCMTEALANVIEHGRAGTPGSPIQLCLDVRRSGSRGEATVTVSDAGVRYDPLAAPLAPRPRTLAEAEPGGLGLIMLRQFADTLEYVYSEGRNHLTIRVRWSEEEAEEAEEEKGSR